MENQNMHDACFVAPLFKGNRKSNGENNLSVVVHDTCHTNKHFPYKNLTFNNLLILYFKHSIFEPNKDYTIMDK
jgi:hypothetical protein